MPKAKIDKSRTTVPRDSPMTTPADQPDGPPPFASPADSEPPVTADSDATLACGIPRPAPANWSRGLPSSLPCKLGRYELQKEIGRGGMGAVYLALDNQLGRHVALKVPLFLGPDADGMRQRFFREARAAALVEHPNICPIHDVGVIDGVHYMTMAYIEGHPLARLIRADRLPSERSAAEVVRLVALAMAEAHAKGVIHRDLKPANILIDRDHRPVVTDFGLARFHTGEGSNLTRPGASMGTPAYMPPEQVNGEIQRMGPGCDIYSLGVILYELLTGRPPFWGKHGELISQVLYSQPRLPSQVRPGVSPVLDAICLKALAKEPEGRFESMRAFADALTRFLAGQPVPPSLRLPAVSREAFTDLVTQIEEAAAEPATPVPPPARPRRRWLWVSAPAAVIVLAIAIYFATRSPREGTGRFGLSDAQAKVEIPIAGRVVAPESDGSYSVTTGEHRLEVNGRGYEPFAETFTARGGATVVVPVPLRLRAVKPLAPPVVGTGPPDGGVDFRELHRADRDTVDTWMDEVRQAGMHASWLMVWTRGKDPRFSAVAVRDGRPVTFIHDLRVPLDPEQGRIDAQYKAGRHPVQRIVYSDSGDWFQAWIWYRYQDTQSSWGFGRGHAGFITGKLRSGQFSGQRPIGLQRCERDGQPYYSLTLGPVGRAPWKEYLELTAAELRQRVNEGRRTGWRPEVVSAYPAPDGGVGFTAVFTNDGDKIGWAFEMDLTAEEYERALETHKAKSMRPLAVAPYDVGGVPRYAAVRATYRPES